MSDAPTAAEGGGAARTPRSGTPPSTVLEVLRAAEGWLRGRGVDSPRLSVEWLLARVLGVTRMELYLAHDQPMSAAERDALRPLVAARGRGVPLAYVLGDASFRGHRIEVTPAVLIPRPETEELVERMLPEVRPGSTGLDLGTGSGAIAVALALEADCRVVAVDVSADALEVARRNVEAHDLGDRIELRAGAFWSPVRADEQFDFVLSNPPYVDPARDDLIAPDVRAHEPHVALFSEPGDPASAYRELAAGLAAHLVPGGWFAFETGVEAADSALAVLRVQELLTAVELEADAAGQPRFLLGRRVALR